ncbi:parathyroid hormone 4 [Thalassophryne amazonica]|uniref:parathyroid hormone 4 n=1 Tax=Thalassophryne amazonica TaxID=390379 RepID=UPI001470F4DB|nr:parathyroid hormone 4 [Thalassophryne amazonica]
MPLQCFALILIVVTFAAAQWQQDLSRRSVSEHQLMHDQGQSIQTLKRLIWLSSAIQALHNVQPRMAGARSPKAFQLDLATAQGPRDPPPTRLRSALGALFDPCLTDLQP